MNTPLSQGKSSINLLPRGSPISLRGALRDVRSDAGEEHE